MGVPFEALLPYGIMVGVSCTPLTDCWSQTDPSRCRCSLSQVVLFQDFDTCKTAESEEGIQLMRGIG
jgi:hypothetical protein